MFNVNSQLDPYTVNPNGTLRRQKTPKVRSIFKAGTHDIRLSQEAKSASCKDDYVRVYVKGNRQSKINKISVLGQLLKDTVFQSAQHIQTISKKQARYYVQNLKSEIARHFDLSVHEPWPKHINDEFFLYLQKALSLIKDDLEETTNRHQARHLTVQSQMELLLKMQGYICESFQLHFGFNPTQALSLAQATPFKKDLREPSNFSEKAAACLGYVRYYGTHLWKSKQSTPKLPVSKLFILGLVAQSMLPTTSANAITSVAMADNTESGEDTTRLPGILSNHSNATIPGPSPEETSSLGSDNICFTRNKTNERDNVLAAVKQDGFALAYAAKELKVDTNIVLAAVNQHGFALRFAAEKLKADPNIVLAAVNQHGFALRYAAEKLKADTNIVLAAVKQHGRALAYAADDLQADPNIVLAAVKQHCMALHFAADTLKKDPDFINQLVSELSQEELTTLLRQLPEMRTNPIFAKAFKAKDGNASQLSLEELKNFPGIFLTLITLNNFYSVLFLLGCMQLIKLSITLFTPVSRQDVENNWRSLEYASDDVKANPEIVLAAVKQSGEALRFAADELKADPGIVLAAVKQDCKALHFAAEKLKADPNIVLAAVNQNAEALYYASQDLKANFNIVFAAVNQDGYTLRYAAEKLQADPNIVLAAVKQNGEALHYASDTLKKDPKFINQLVSE
ncbi:MAG: DUF4116 domain-containing protein, partial [bacterium]